MTRIIGPSGIEIDIDECTASGLVDGGHARYVVDSPAEDLPKGNASLADPDDFATETSEPVVDSPAEDLPKGNASLAEWTEYATDAGKDVTGLSRDEIRALFKG